MKVKVNNKIAKYQLTGDTRDTCYFKIMDFCDRVDLQKNII